MPPMNHFTTHGMSPVHVAPDGGVRVVLEEHVVPAIPINGAVGIIHPVSCGKQMKLGTKWIGSEALAQTLGLPLPEKR
jgi:hypothetical protein